MLIQIYITVMAIFLQGSGSAPPVPKMGPAPPVGDQVPIDENIWVLFVTALGVAVWYFYSIHRKKLQP